MPRLLTGDISNPTYIAIEVAFVCYIIHSCMGKASMEAKCLTVGAIMGLYEKYLQDRAANSPM